MFISSRRRTVAGLAMSALAAAALVVGPALLPGVGATAGSQPVPLGESHQPTPRSAQPVAQQYFYTDADDPQQSLVATVDPTATDARWVVVVHGGSWSSGSDQDPQALDAVDVLSHHGYQVFDINYRLIDDADPGEAAVAWPEQRDDVIDAIAWVRAHADAFDLNPDRGAVWGFSAGGQLAAIAGLDGDGDNGIRAIVSVDGVVEPQRLWQDLEGERPAEKPTPHMVTLAGWTAVAAGCPYGTSKGTCAQRWQAFEPASYLSPHDPGVMIFSGEADTWVPWQMAQSFSNSLDAAHVQSYLVLVPKLQHDVRTALDGGVRQAEMLRFLDRRTAVTVPPSVSRITARATSTRVRPTEHVVISAEVASVQGTSGGAVSVSTGRVRETVEMHGDAVKIVLPRLTRGRHVVVVKYLGTPLTQTATTTVTVTVV